MNQNSFAFLVLNILTARQTEVEISNEIIQQFVEHNIIFHFDDDNKFIVESIVSKVDTNRFYLLNNYDKTNITLRPNGYKFLHIVLLTNYSRFNVYSHINVYSLRYVDVLLFLVPRDFTLWPGNTLEKAGSLIVFETWNLSLYTICFYCGKLTRSLRKIDGWLRKDNTTFDVPKLTGFTNTFDDFNQHVFHVGYNIYKPLFFGHTVEQPRNHTIHDGLGIEHALLLTLSEKLNFTCTLIPFFTHKSSWAAVVTAVSRSELDFAISGITLTLPRTRLVDFTARIRTEPYAVLYALYEDRWMAWRGLLMPFTAGVWGVLAGVVGVMAWGVGRVVGEVPGVFFVQGWLRLLFEQSIPNIHKSLKNRWPVLFFMTIWFMLALIINNSYKSKLTSSLIHSKAKEFDTVDQLVDKGYYFQMNDFDSTVLQDNLRLSADPKFLEALKRSDNETEYCKSIVKTTNGLFAFIDEITLMQNVVQEKCRSLLPPSTQDLLRLLRDDIFPSTHAWPLQLNSPFRVKFNEVISRLHAAGLFAKWAGDVAPPEEMVPRSHQRHQRLDAPSFNLASMLGPAIIWSIGICLATLVFIGERIRPRYSPRLNSQGGKPRRSSHFGR